MVSNAIRGKTAANKLNISIYTIRIWITKSGFIAPYYNSDLHIIHLPYIFRSNIIILTAFFEDYATKGPISGAERSNAMVCGHSFAGIAGSNPAGGINVSCECCVLSGRGLCIGTIPRWYESYRLWCVIVCDLETSEMRLSWPRWAVAPDRKKYKMFMLLIILSKVSPCYRPRRLLGRIEV
jgi:hypothetical protein